MTLGNSKALRCTFFGWRKYPGSSNFVQLELLNRGMVRSSKNCAAQGFHYLHEFVYLKYFWTQSETVHLQDPFSFTTVHLKALLYIYCYWKCIKNWWYIDLCFINFQQFLSNANLIAKVKTMWKFSIGLLHAFPMVFNFNFQKKSYWNSFDDIWWPI